jgi:transposase-like protein
VVRDPRKSHNESTIQLLLADRHPESITVYTDESRTYEALEDADAYDREYVIHGDGKCAGDEVHVKTCKSHGRTCDAWLSPHRGISNNRLTQYLRAFHLRWDLFRKPG